MEISYDEDEDSTLFVTYVGGDPYDAPAIWRSEQNNSVTSEGYHYLHRDYLGSIMLITDDSGDAKEKRHFDAWGKIVKLTDGNNNALDEFKILDRGYTGHEHLQGVNLIHMNGRIYDPNLRRFLSPDNFIQDLYNTQNYNRYGYVLNNPLMYVDTNGEFIETLIAVVVIIAKAVFVASAAVGAYALISNLIDQSGNGSGSNPAQDSPLSSTNQNNSQEIASSMPRIPNSGYRLDYGNNFGNFAISPEYNSIANNSISSAIGAATASAMFDNIGNGNNLGGGDGGITTSGVLRTLADFTPLGSVLDIKEGIESGDGWQVALGVGSLVLDVFTLGSASLVKGAVKTGIKHGIKHGSKAIAKNTAAKLSSNAAKLNKHYKLAEKYGKGGYKHLQNGRTRYYNKARKNSGDGNSWRTVKEWNPANGKTRTWHETLNPKGRVIQTRPELGSKYRHYKFDDLGNYLGWW
jgi:RHS repeat-associated protein